MLRGQFHLGGLCCDSAVLTRWFCWGECRSLNFLRALNGFFRGSARGGVYTNLSTNGVIDPVCPFLVGVSRSGCDDPATCGDVRHFVLANFPIAFLELLNLSLLIRGELRYD